MKIFMGRDQKCVSAKENINFVKDWFNKVKPVLSD